MEDGRSHPQLSSIFDPQSSIFYLCPSVFICGFSISLEKKMSDMTARLIWNGGLKFTGVNAGGIETAIDGDHQAGATPMEILLEAVGACSAIDVVLIMEKARTPLMRFEV